MLSKRTPILTFIFFALLYYTQSQEVIDSLKNQLYSTSGKERVETMIKLSESYRYEDFDSCVVYGNKAVKFAKKLGFGDLEALGLKSTGVSYYYAGQLEKSYDYYLKSSNIYKIRDDTLGVANCLNNLGILLEEWGDLSTALEYYKESLKLKYKIGNQKGIASSLQSIGNICFYQNKYQQAIDHYNQALNIFRDIDDLNNQALCLNNIGIVYMRWNRNKKALDFFMIAQKVFRDFNNLKMLSSIFINIAEIYNFEYNNYDTALYLYNQSLILKEKINDNVGIALLKNNIGTLYGNMKNYNTAYKYFEESKLLYQELNAIGGSIMVIYNMGKVYQAEGEYQEAIHNFKSSLASANEHGYIDFIKSNQEALFECYAAICNYEQFEKYYQLYKTGQDTLLDRINEAEMLEIEAKYSAEIANSKSKLLQDKLDNKLKELWMYKLLLTSILGLVVITLLVCFVKISKSK